MSTANKLTMITRKATGSTEIMTATLNADGSD